MAHQADSAAVAAHDHPEGVRRRDFIHIASGTFAIGGAAVALWPFINQMNASADVRAMASIELDIGKIPVGSGIVAKYLGNPVFIRHRTQAEISAAAKVVVADLRDPQTDAERVKPGKEQWLITKGVCTHLGCVPGGIKPTEVRGSFGGYFCPCHGSSYDTSGRIRKGPAPKNLEVPKYAFLSDTKIKIG